MSVLFGFINLVYLDYNPVHARCRGMGMGMSQN